MEDLLWKRIRNNEIAAFSELYKAYYHFLFNQGFRICADKELTKDCIHDMFLEIWGNKESLPQVQHVGFYLKTYLTRKITSSARVGKDLILPEGLPGEYASAEYSYEDILIATQSGEEMKNRVRAAILTLTKAQLQVITLKFFQGKTYEEIAKIKSAAPRTIYNQVYQSLKLLRQHLRFVGWLFSFLFNAL